MRLGPRPHEQRAVRRAPPRHRAGRYAPPLTVPHTGQVPAALPQGDPAPADGRLPATALGGVPDVPFGVYVHVPFCQTPLRLLRLQHLHAE